MDNKMKELQDKLVEAAKKGVQEELTALKAEIDSLKTENSRFQVKAENQEYNLKTAAKAIANAPGLKAALENRSNCRITLPEHPLELAKKSVTYNPGNQTISGDVRRVLASTDRPGILQLPLRPPAIRDLLSVVPTTSAFINWVAETGTTNDAAYVALGGTKPESDVALVIRRQPVETIAHYIKVPLQLARDINSFESYLEQRLVDMLRVKCEDAYLTGDGTSNNLLGILNFPNIQTYTQVSGENRIDAIRQALTKLETSFYPWADAILVHPNDVMRMELLKDQQDRYLWPLFGRWSDGSYSSKTLFGVPVISTTTIDEGTFLVGNFGRGATLYQRTGVNVEVSFSDQDDFIKNLMTIRVEADECLVPEYGGMFVSGTFLGSQYD